MLDCYSLLARRPLRWLLPLLALLSSCAVYVPMQGAAPEIGAKGELEATANWSLTNRFEASAVYSPISHLLVRAAASTKGQRPAPSDSSNYAQSKQYELSLGTYWPLGPRWLAGGLVGFGQTHAEAQYERDGNSFLFFGQRPLPHQFDAHYTRYTGEAYLTWRPNPVVSLGLSYRLVQLRLTDVTDRGRPVQAGPVLRYEPMVYLRVRPAGSGGMLQLQAAMGASGTFGYDARTTDDAADPARQFRLGRGYVSLGLAFYPLRRRQK